MSPLFESGDAAFRVGLRPIPEETWLEPGEADAERKDALLARAPAMVWGELDGSRPGQGEALALVEGHLRRGARRDDGEPFLWCAGRLVADDLCLMEQRAGEWTLSAASLCSPSFFTAEHAVGLCLKRLHGPVPGFEAGLLRRVERVFDALRPGLVLERRNWTVVPSSDLFLPDPAPVRAAFDRLEGPEALASLHVRMERQTLRRLPETGGALFTIRVHRHPVAALRDPPARLEAFAQAWTAAMSPEGEPFRRYKGLERYDPAVRAFLAEASPRERMQMTSATYRP